MTDIRLVRDLMTVGVSTCSPDTLITEIVRTMLDTDLEALAVLDHDGHAVGVVSQDEVIRAYGRDDRTLKAGDIMHEGVPEIPPDIPVAAAAQIMQYRRRG
jgi:CBS domain-containing protein